MLCRIRNVVSSLYAIPAAAAYLKHGACVELGKAAAVVSETVGGCRGLACSLLLVGNFVTSSATTEASMSLASSCPKGSARSQDNPHLERVSRPSDTMPTHQGMASLW